MLCLYRPIAPMELGHGGEAGLNKSAEGREQRVAALAGDVWEAVGQNLESVAGLRRVFHSFTLRLVYSLSTPIRRSYVGRCTVRHRLRVSPICNGPACQWRSLPYIGRVHNRARRRARPVLRLATSAGAVRGGGNKTPFHSLLERLSADGLLCACQAYALKRTLVGVKVE